MESKTYDTIIVGMGASGVTTLSQLSKAGRSVLGLEAADYIGGRVRTISFGKGIVELGAEWIHGERPSKVFDLATDNHIPIMSQDLTAATFRSDGTLLDKELMNELFGFCLEIVDYPPTVAEPLGVYITQKLREHLADRPEILNDEDFMSGFLDLMNLMVNNYESSNDWNDVSTSSKYTPVDGDQHWSWHKYGYKTLFDILLNKYNNGSGLPADILLNKEVENIVWSNEPNKEVEIRCKDGGVYRGHNVVVTVSLGVLKHSHGSLFSPPLPTAKVQAIDHITMGVMGKVILSWADAWWPAGTSFFAFLWSRADRARVRPEDAWTTNIFGFSTPLSSDNCLTFWTCGDFGKHIESLPEDVVKRKVTDLLRKFVGKTYQVPEPSGIVKSNWFHNPLTRGSYTYDSVIFTEHPTARADLTTPLCDTNGTPKVMFAGEATNEYHFSTVHGAMETGLREAERILSEDNVKTKSKILNGL